MPCYCENCSVDIFLYHHVGNHEFFENALTNQDVITFSIPVPQLSDRDIPNFYLTPSNLKLSTLMPRLFFSCTLIPEV